VEVTEKGFCPVCRTKLKQYSRFPQRNFFCHNCDRAFDLETRQFKPNFAWLKPNKPTQAHLDNGRPIYAEAPKLRAR
jgi:hypothetical protein